MPIHDWTRLEAGDFHHFHQAWITYIANNLNGGLLPPEFMALSEQVTGRPIPDVVTLQTHTPHRVGQEACPLHRAHRRLLGSFRSLSESTMPSVKIESLFGTVGVALWRSSNWSLRETKIAVTRFGHSSRWPLILSIKGFTWSSSICFRRLLAIRRLFTKLLWTNLASCLSSFCRINRSLSHRISVAICPQHMSSR